MTTPSHSERRRHPRFTADVEINVIRANHAGSEPLAGVLVDYSQSGARVLLEQPLPTGERIAFKVGEGFDDCFTLSAKVVWTERTNDGRYQCGCALPIELTQRQMELLSQFAGLQLV